MSRTSFVTLVAFLAALLACKGEAPEDTADTCEPPLVQSIYCGYAEGCATYEEVCNPEDPRLIMTVDLCGNKVEDVETCLGDFLCTTSPEYDFAFCACPIPDEPLLGCYAEGNNNGPQETRIGHLDECDQLIDVAITCPIGDRCWYTWNEDGSLADQGQPHCASSMEPEQYDSPWYRYACDMELWMHATTSMIMDCRCNQANAAMQECRPGSDAWGQGLRIGTGPNIHGINFAKWGGGFIHNGELYAAVRYTGGSNGAHPGAIYAIDIVTGDRRVVTGSYQTSTGQVDVGSGSTVNGDALPELTHIKLGADGMIYAIGSSTLEVEITRVDPTTGERTLLWRRQQLADGMNASYPFGQCYDGRVSTGYLGGYQPVQYAERAFALGPDGSFYLGWNNDGVGVVRISPDGSTCTHVSRWASRNNTAPLPDIGGGIVPQYDTISGLLHHDGTVYAFTKDMLISIDDVSGDRAIFSYVSGIGGNGETNFFVDESRDVMFACGTVGARKCSVHTMADGNVAQGLFDIGQEFPVIQGKYPVGQSQGAKGALDNNNHNGYGAVAMDPNDNNILYFVVLSGVIKYEIDTGNSHFMSM